jgi:hypothetical protein
MLASSFTLGSCKGILKSLAPTVHHVSSANPSKPLLNSARFFPSQCDGLAKATSPEVEPVSLGKEDLVPSNLTWPARTHGAGTLRVQQVGAAQQEDIVLCGWVSIRTRLKAHIHGVFFVCSSHACPGEIKTPLSGRPIAAGLARTSSARVFRTAARMWRLDVSPDLCSLDFVVHSMVNPGEDGGVYKYDCTF